MYAQHPSFHVSERSCYIITTHLSLHIGPVQAGFVVTSQISQIDDTCPCVIFCGRSGGVRINPRFCCYIKEIIRQEGQLNLKAYVIQSWVLPPSGQTDKLLPAEGLQSPWLHQRRLHKDRYYILGENICINLEVHLFFWVALDDKGASRQIKTNHGKIIFVT